MDLSLAVPAFIAGMFTFLAPCTLPFVPAYLGFISGVSNEEMRDPKRLRHVRGKVVLNGFLYVTGFTAVFVLMGTVFGVGGIALAAYRVWLARIAGVFVILFGLYLMHAFKLPFLRFLSDEKRFNFGRTLKPGKPLSALIFGSTFAFGWSPCVGPILGSILLLASSGQTVWSGAFLLFVFSLGLGLPFMVIAFSIGHATSSIRRISRYMKYVSVAGGAFLTMLGVLMVTDSMRVWLTFAYRLFSFIDYESILNFL